MLTKILKPRLVAGSILLLTFVTYYPILTGAYNMDDNLVTQNHPRTSGGISSIMDIIGSGYYEDSLSYKFDYRPITHLFFAIEHSLFGESAAAAHLINLILYALCCMLVYTVCRKIVGNDHLTLLITLFFLLHPIHSEVVCSIKNRDELLSFVFGLLAINIILKKKNITLIWATVVFSFLVLSVLSKFTGVLYVLFAITSFLAYYKVNRIILFTCLFFSFVFIAIVCTTPLIGFFNIETIGFFVLIILALTFYRSLANYLDKVRWYEAIFFFLSFIIGYCIKWEYGFTLAALTLSTVVFTDILASRIYRVDIGYEISLFLLLILYLVIIKTEAFQDVLLVPILLAVFDRKFTLWYMTPFLLAGSLLYLCFGVSTSVYYEDIGFLIRSSLHYLVIFASVSIPFLFKKFRYSKVIALTIWLVILIFNFIALLRNPDIGFSISFIFQLYFFYFAIRNIPSFLVAEGEKRFSFVLKCFFVLVGFSSITFAVYHANLHNANLIQENSISVNRIIEFVENNVFFISNPLQKLIAFSKICITNLMLLLFPVQQYFFYGYNFLDIQFGLIYIIIGACSLGLILLSILYNKQLLKMPLEITIICGILMLGSLLFPIPGIIAERLLFGVSLFFLILVCSFVYYIPLHSSFKFLLVTPIFIFFCYASNTRAKLWQTPTGLMQHDVDAAPFSAKGNNLLATQYITAWLNDSTNSNARIYLEAATHYARQAVTVFPQFSNFWYDLARIHAYNKDFKGAIVAYYKAYDTDKGNITPLLAIHQLSIAMQDYEAIISVNNKMLETNKNRIQSYIDIIEAYSLLGQQEKSIQWSDTAIKYFPTNKNVLIQRGNLLYQLKQNKSAYFFYKSAFHLDVSNNAFNCFFMRFCKKYGMLYPSATNPVMCD